MMTFKEAEEKAHNANTVCPKCTHKGPLQGPGFGRNEEGQEVLWWSCSCGWSMQSYCADLPEGS